MVQAFPKKWWVESEFKAPKPPPPFHHGSKPRPNVTCNTLIICPNYPAEQANFQFDSNRNTCIHTLIIQRDWTSDTDYVSVLPQLLTEVWFFKEKNILRSKITYQLLMRVFIHFHIKPFYSHYVIKFVNDLRQVDGFLRVPRFPPPIKLTATYIWNIVEIAVKHH